LSSGYCLSSSGDESLNFKAAAYESKCDRSDLGQRTHGIRLPVCVRSVVVSGRLPSNTAVEAWSDRGCRPAAAQDLFGAQAAARKARLPRRERKVSVPMNVYRSCNAWKPVELAKVPRNANDFRALAYSLAPIAPFFHAIVALPATPGTGHWCADEQTRPPPKGSVGRCEPAPSFLGAVILPVIFNLVRRGAAR
jgi:hypothetical protein